MVKSIAFVTSGFTILNLYHYLLFLFCFNLNNQKMLSLRLVKIKLYDMSINEKDVLSVLNKIKHPDSDRSIVEDGMVSNLKIDGAKVSFILNFKRVNDPFINSVKSGCVRALTAAIEGIDIKGNILTVTQKPEPKAKAEKPKDEPLKGVKNIIAIASGKGGVGKSTVATNLSIALAKTGAKVGLIDADIYGPSMPKMFNLEDAKPALEKRDGKDWIIPAENYGVKVLSIGFFVKEEDALVWRGPMATSTLKQLINQGDWGALDYLLIDLPPGTGDIHLTMVQEIPVTGAVIVTTPQKVALADAIKGINMFRGESVNVPILGLIENMAWFTPDELPDNKYYIFGKDGGKNLADSLQIPLLGQIPIVQSIREGGDNGEPAVIQGNGTSKAFTMLCDEVIKQVNLRNNTKEATKVVEIDPNAGCSN